MVPGARPHRRLTRPITVLPLLDGWHIEHHARIGAWALTSEIVIASK
jgi:hypothetical protein